MNSSLLKSKWQDLELNHLFASSLTTFSTPCLSSQLVKVTRAMKTQGQARLLLHKFVMVNVVCILGVTVLKGQDDFLPVSGQAGNVNLGIALTPVKFKESKLWSWRHRLGCSSLVRCPPHWLCYLWPRPKFSHCSGGRVQGAHVAFYWKCELKLGNRTHSAE